jgi:hypothetical protein
MPRKGAPARTDADDRFDDSRDPHRTLASNGKRKPAARFGLLAVRLAGALYPAPDGSSSLSPPATVAYASPRFCTPPGQPCCRRSAGLTRQWGPSPAHRQLRVDDHARLPAPQSKDRRCLASALLRRLGRGTVRCSRYLRARHENDDGYAPGSRGRAPAGGSAGTAFSRGGGAFDCADRPAARSDARDREGVFLFWAYRVCPARSVVASEAPWRSGRLVIVATNARRGRTAPHRVVERWRAAALARHYRDHEGLPIAEVARRLGRAEATINAYVYDPTGEKARAVKARYAGVCRGGGG